MPTTAAAVPPNVTVAPALKSAPSIVTDVPPAEGPESGVTPLTEGAGNGDVYLNPPESIALCPSILVTVTLTAPTPWAGVVAEIEFELTTATPVAIVPPNDTPTPDAKFAPVIVTDVPPSKGPV